MPKSRAEFLESRLPALVETWRAELGRGCGFDRPAQPGKLARDEIRLVGDALLSLQRGLTGERGLAGSGYMDRPGLLGAYLLYYWPVSYLQVSLALEACLPRLGSGPIRVLDLGSGPGPASAALFDAGARDFVLADSSERALKIAQRVIPGLLRPEGEGGTKAPSITTLAMDLEAGPAELESRIASLAGAPFDLVVASHCLNELFKGADDRIGRRCALIERITRLVSPRGIVLLVEPSLLSTSRDLFAIRDALAARGFRVISPCLRQGPCPALAAGPGQTCHAEAAWEPPEPVASLAAAAGLDRESVKMSYIALSPPAAGAPEGEHDLKLSGTTNTNDKATFATCAPAAGAAFEALVVSEPMLNKAGRVRYLLCGEEGRFTFSARRDDQTAAEAGFFGLSRYDRIRVAGAEARPRQGEAASFGFAPGTRLETASPSPRIGARPRSGADARQEPSRGGAPRGPDAGFRLRRQGRGDRRK